MKRTLLLGLLVSSTALAQPVSIGQGWGDLGNLLNNACKLVTGRSNISGIPVGDVPNLEWLCGINNLYRFVDGTILRGDWAQFGKDVLGQWIADYANAMAGSLNLASVGDWVDFANDAVRQGYGEFRRRLMYAIRDSYRLGDNHVGSSFPEGTAQKVAESYILTNPAQGAINEVGRQAKIHEATGNLVGAWEMESRDKATREELARIQETALGTATTVVGTAGLGPTGVKGQADTLVERAQAAISTRQVGEIQVAALASLMKQNAVLSSSVVAAVVQSAKQQLLTNAQLNRLIEAVQGEASTAIDAQRAELEELAQADLDAAEGFKKQVDVTATTLERYYDPALLGGLTW